MKPSATPFQVLLVSILAWTFTVAVAQDAAVEKPAAVEAAQPSEPPPVPKYPEPDTVLAAMKKATAFFRSNLSVAGGYASTWPRDIKETRTENRAGAVWISIQPPGTPSVGGAMLDAFLATGDPLFRQGAREAAEALMWCQYASGGWGPEHSLEPQFARRYHYRRDIEGGDLEPGKRSRRSSLDDNKTQNAIRFLMHLANSPAGEGDEALRHALDFAWDGLLAAQAPNGGWPQMYSGPADTELPVTKASYPAEWSRVFPAVDYTPYYTLNDNNLFNVMILLLEAHGIESHDNQRFLEAAKRLGNFLLLAQMPEPQPVWAQQYNHDMHPDWARKFEPPAVCSIESLGAMKALIEIWMATGDEKYLAPLPAAIAWFERSQLEDGVWARFYEMQSNTPLYCKAETYEVTYDDSDLPTHYGYKVTGSFGRTLTRLKEELGKSRDELLAQREGQTPDSEKEWSDRARKLASKVREALKGQKKEGYWVKGESIDAGEFGKHMKVMTDYLEASREGGASYDAVRKKEGLKEEAKAKAEADAQSKPPL